MPIIQTQEDKSILFKKRHSASHALAQAVLEIFPGAQLGIGPATDDGFYYDFLLEEKITPEHLPIIEQRMKEIIKQGHDLIYEEIPDEEKAKALFKNQRFKVELIEDIKNKGEKISIYRQGDFYDLCKGPHVKSFKDLNPDGIKLLKVAGAYWKGDETREMFQRIYGTYFDKKEELTDYLEKLSQAEKYDHRVLGKQLKIFMISQSIGAGLVTWLPKGAQIKHTLETMLRKILTEYGYVFTSTPHIGKAELWNTSGHLDHYQENMFPQMVFDNEAFFLKPMNCPFHIEVFRTVVQSYRDLPLRLAEFGTVYRYERSGTLHGLTRVRGFTQDDAHIFCSRDQLFDELSALIEMCFKILHIFKFQNLKIYLSTKPNNSTGDTEIWSFSEEILKRVLDDKGIYYYVDWGGGAFYGPKIDLKAEDNLGREWQLSTIQLDFNLPEKFKISFTNKNNQPERPIIIHRAILGSMERFIGVLLEHFKGNLPFWISPEQMRIITVSESHIPYAEEIAQILKNFRLTKDYSAEKLGFKIRNAEVDKIPCMIIIGDKEESSKTVSVRFKGAKTSEVILADNLYDFFKNKEECWE